MKKGLKRRALTKEFKLQVVAEVDAGKPQAQVAREHRVTANTIAKRRKQLRHKEHAFSGRGKAYTDEARIGELERLVGRLTMENDLLKKALLRLDS